MGLGHGIQDFPIHVLAELLPGPQPQRPGRVDRLASLQRYAAQDEGENACGQVAAAGTDSEVAA